jgi:cation/acetate symporter
MTVEVWTWIFVGITFAAYLYIGYSNRVRDTSGFYVAGQGVPAIANGAATAADWMSAASFISMAGLIAFLGYDGVVYLMGWTGGYVLLTLLLAPYLRKFGKYTVPDFVGDRYYSQTARTVAAIAAIFVSFTYVAGQMRGVGIVFSRFLGLSITGGVVVGMVIVAFFAVLGGMKGITWTQVAQYSVLITAFLIPAIALSLNLTGIPIPQLAFAFSDFVPQLEALQNDLGLGTYIYSNRQMIDVFAITLALMAGTAGLPHVIVRFYTVPSVRPHATLAAGRYSLLACSIPPPGAGCICQIQPDQLTPQQNV